MRSDNMKEFKSTDLILNTMYEEYKMRDELLKGFNEETHVNTVTSIDIYGHLNVCAILTGAIIYAYSSNRIQRREFTELLNVINELMRR
jgi:hypothetical protein